MKVIGTLNSYELDDTALASGGEGAVYKIKNQPDLVAKIYHQEKLNVDPKLASKIKYMVNNPPDKSVLNQVSWPMDVLEDNMGNFIGFTMPKLETDTDLKSIYPYPPKKSMPVSNEQKIIIAINICIVISEIHKAGYVFGDFNPMNIGVNLKTGHVAFFDTDSYHFTDPKNGYTYRCGVGADGYIAQELIQHCHNNNADFLSAPLPTFTKETDEFALAIHIFKLLMNGYTPFNGIKECESASQSSPGTGNIAIERDNYCFKPGNKPQSPATPDLSCLTPDIQFLFKKTFLGGNQNPESRATPEEWKEALIEYKDNLKQCDKEPMHSYYINNGTCPYCEADTRYQQSISQVPSSFSSGSSQVSFSSPVQVPPTQKQPVQQSSAFSNAQKKSTVKTVFKVIMWILFWPYLLLHKSRMALIFKIILGILILFICLEVASATAGKILYHMNNDSPSGNNAIVEQSGVALELDVQETFETLIKGYNNFGYFDLEQNVSGTFVDDDEQNDYTYKIEPLQENNSKDTVKFLVKIDKAGTPIGDITLSVECNSMMSNDELITFMLDDNASLSADGKLYDLTLKNNSFRITTLEEKEFANDNPRDHAFLQGVDSEYFVMQLYDTSYNVDDKTIKLQVIDDKRPGAKNVDLKLRFTVYSKNNEELFEGDYVLRDEGLNGYLDIIYDVNDDSYGDRYWCGNYRLVSMFDEKVALEKTGILFNVEESNDYEIKTIRAED